MSMPDIRVEVGFDLTDSAVGSFFRLDDDVAGRLDNTVYTLGGTLFYDVTEFVSGVNIRRGKQPIDSNYTPGEVEIQFNNHNRYFDPTYTASPYNGNIVPRREVRVFGNDVEIYRGWIDDWNLSYSNDGDSIAIALAFDALFLLNTRVVFPFVTIEEKSGARIERVLDLPEVGWPTELRRIDEGQVTIAANPVEESRDVLGYLQSIAGSDPGDVFISRDGYLEFDDRTRAARSDTFVQFGGTAIPFNAVNVSYGAEQLFNEIVLTRQNGGTVTVSDDLSISGYGRRTWDITDSQVSTDAQLVDIGLGLAGKYSRPQYRFDSVDVYMNKLTVQEQTDIMELDFGDVCKIIFHPNNIGDPIEKWVEVINIEHRIDSEQHVATLGFAEILAAPLVLNDAVFGKLDEGVLSW